MTQEQLPNNTLPSESATTAQRPQSMPQIGFLPSLGILLLELILPVTLAGAFSYWLSGTIRLWSLNHVVALVIFAVIFIVVSLFTTVILDGLTLPFRKRSTVKNVINPVGRRARLVKYIVIGILIPAGLFGAANLVVLPQGGTSMELVEKHSQQIVKASSTAVIADAVLGSNLPMTKIQGIKTLQTVHSSDSLDQLFRILNTDPAVFVDAGVYETLSEAIASYGTAAKKGLLEVYANGNQPVNKPEVSPGQDAYSWYFSVPFDELSQEIQAQNPDQARREADLARLASAETALKQSLTAMETQFQPLTTSNPVPDFVVHTFLGMNITQDKEVLQFAKDIARDSGFSSGTRGQAILLIGKIGGEEELSELYSYLENSDEFIKAKTLEAIASLQSRMPQEDNAK
jgi:hypothetical protein